MTRIEDRKTRADYYEERKQFIAEQQQRYAVDSIVRDIRKLLPKMER